MPITIIVLEDWAGVSYGIVNGSLVDAFWCFSGLLVRVASSYVKYVTLFFTKLKIMYTQCCRKGSRVFLRCKNIHYIKALSKYIKTLRIMHL